MDRAVMDDVVHLMWDRVSQTATTERVDALVDELFGKLVGRLYPFLLISAITVFAVILMLVFVCFNTHQIKLVHPVC